MDSDMQIFKAQRRHKFIMWTVVALCALFSLINILAAASGGWIGQAFAEYMDNHESFALLVKSTGLYGFLPIRARRFPQQAKKCWFPWGWAS